MEKTISNQPLIYYLIQGTSSRNKKSVFNEKFVHDNPLIARKMAFDYFEYNIQLTKENQKEQVTKKIKSKYILDDSNNFIVLKSEQNLSNNGVCLYFVVSNTVIFENKNIQSDNFFLLHVEQAFTDGIVIEMKNALIREISMYQYLNINPTFNESIIKINFKSAVDFLPDEKAIIKTPFDFKRADFNTFLKNLFDCKILVYLNKINHLKSSFINVLDWHNIRIHVSSFLNTNSGYIFLGNIKNTNIVTSIFDGRSLTEITNDLHENISNHFPKHQNYFSFEFITINNALIIIIVFKTYVTPCYYNNETNNNFYYRDRNGINSMNKTSQIVSYVNNQNSRNVKNIQNIINNL